MGSTLSLRGGTHSSGGRLSLAALVAVRDAAGNGPTTPWRLTFANAEGEVVAEEAYDDQSPGSFMGFWWPGVAPEGQYVATATVGGAQGSVRFEVSESVLEPVSAGVFSRSTNTLSWTASPNALSYSCRLYRGDQLLSSSGPSASASCSFGELADGAYAASVYAFTADLQALASDRNPLPEMPAYFDVSESQLGLAVRGDAGFRVQASGGPLNYGSVTSGIALGIDVADLAGKSTASDWDIEFSGPAFAAGQPYRGRLAAGVRKLVVWSYDHRARAGVYSAEAVSDAGVVATDFVVDDGSPLPTPVGTLVQARANGGAEVTWEPVPNAASYLASAWARGATSATAEIWVGSSPADFPTNTFAAGTTYDVYVAATNVDVLGPAPMPSTVKVSENTYSPAVFTAQ